MTEVAPPRLLLIACGALARELVEVVRANGLGNVTVACLPAELHNEPDRIPQAVRTRVEAGRRDFDQILVAYADCGTGGRLDAVCAELGVERLPGAHCYELFAGREVFAALHEREPGTFYLTDYLARNFDRLVMGSLGLDRHPQLLPTYFGNYRRLVHLAQTDDPALDAAARRAAARLGLQHERRATGYGLLAPLVVDRARRVAAGVGA